MILYQIALAVVLFVIVAGGQIVIDRLNKREEKQLRGKDEK